MSVGTKWLSGLLLTFSIFAALPSTSHAQNGAGEALPRLVQANERFGRKLLLELHKPAPDRNVVVSPLSVTLMMAAVQTSTGSDAIRKQMDTAFGWGKYPQLLIPSRMLLVAFEKPVPLPLPGQPASRPATYLPEGAWITNTLLYRSVRGGDPIDANFRRQAKKYFQVELIRSLSSQPSAPGVARLRKGETALPKVAANTDAWMVSGTHIRARWSGNTFSMSKPTPGTFHASGGDKTASMLSSELSGFLYAEAEHYQAVALPADEAYMLAVLPKPNSNLAEIERELTENPEALDSTLKKRLGIVTMPVFHIRNEADLRPPLEGLGVKAIFEDLPGIFSIPKTHIQSFTQKIDIEVNKDGIRADAETVAGVVYGGILVGKEPFHLVLDRPFLFLIREQNTNALMFLGAVADPTQQ